MKVFAPLAARGTAKSGIPTRLRQDGSSAKPNETSTISDFSPALAILLEFPVSLNWTFENSSSPSSETEKPEHSGL